jgi:hypothetical protein
MIGWGLLPAGQLFHNAGEPEAKCRRQIEKSPLAQIGMSLSAVSVGEH